MDMLRSYKKLNFDSTFKTGVYRSEYRLVSVDLNI